MKTLRFVHLYLGCFFAPLITFFCLSGIWQELGFQDNKANTLIRLLSSLHTGHLSEKSKGSSLGSTYIQVFAIAMAASLVVSIILGVILAFRYGRGPLALGSLAAGFAMPLALILVFGHA
jgi:hypothetical protein